MKIKIHHFFDMIRDFGSGKKIVPHPHLHAYHSVAQIIRNGANIELELVAEADIVCATCTQLINAECDDVITHRTDFAGKEDFNNHLDNRIMQVCGFEKSKKYTPKILCESANLFLENIDFIYEGNDLEHTLQRKINVIKGLKYYAEKHGFEIS